MVPTHATKNRVRYRYYISAACLRGPTDQAVGSVRRVPAHGIELAVKKAIVADRTGGMFGSDGLDYTCVTLTAIIAKIEVLPSQLAIHYKPDGNPASKDYDMDDEQRASTKARVLIIPWKKRRSPEKFFVQIQIPSTVSSRSRLVRAWHSFVRSAWADYGFDRPSMAKRLSLQSLPTTHAVCERST